MDLSAITEFQGADGATRANFNEKIQEANAEFEAQDSNLTAHASDAVAHLTQADHDKITGAVDSATLGGAVVPKSGTTLQLPAYPVIPGSLPANGGTADYAHYSSHAVGSGGAALRNNTATVGGSPSGGSDGDGWDICT
mgnify:CR=1 FL=1|nr:MAG TPA: hypothetical protein [Caudoviricetes sp.]